MVLRRDFGRVSRKDTEEEEKQKGEEESRTVKRVLLGLSLFLFAFDFFSLGDDRRRGGFISIFAQAGGGGSFSRGFWLSSSGMQSSNFGLAIVVTALAGLALAATVVYSRR